MQVSIVSFKTTKENIDFRYEPEFFLPKYIEYENRLLRKKTVRLRDCALFENGRAFDSKGFSLDGDVYVSKIGDVTQKRDYSLWEKVSSSHFAKLKAKYLRHDDILMTLTGDPPDVGKTQLIVNPPEKTLSWNQRVALIRLKKQDNIISPEYLFTTLSTKYCREHIERWAKGIRQRNVGNPAVLSMSIPVLSLDFQRRVTRITEEAFSFVNKSESLYKEAEQNFLAELGLKNWKPKHQLSFIKSYSDTQFADRIDADYFQPVYDEVLKAVKFVKSYARLGDLVSIKKCVEPGSEAYQDSGIPFVRVSNLSKFGINNDNQQFISESLYESLEMHQPKKGEILLSKDATPGIAYYLREDPGKIIPSSGILRLTVKDANKTIPEYLTLVLNSVIVQKQIERDVGGSVINHWLVDQVKDALIPILEVSTQQQISEQLAESFSNREQSKRLLEIAKHGVEMAIEKSEEEAQNWINQEVKKH